MFIMIDGIEGGGKSTIMETWKQFLLGTGKTIFDLKKYCQETGSIPDYSAIQPYDVICTAEPTYFGIGKIIRERTDKKRHCLPRNSYCPRLLSGSVGYVYKNYHPSNFGWKNYYPRQRGLYLSMLPGFKR
jgi:thymidylate kinase